MTSFKQKNLLDLDTYSSEDILTVLDTAKAMLPILRRPIARVPTLRGKTVAMVFFEASTRTRVSFELAAKSLGADVISIGNSGSSVEKGESVTDTLNTIQSLGANVLVIRHHASGAPYLAARTLDIPVINAGDGSHAHPSQALLDMFTINSEFGQIRGKRVVIVGDILHSRVARSNIWGLTKMGATVVLSGPSQLLPSHMQEIPGFQDQISTDPNLDRAIEGADVIMALRIQKERMTSMSMPDIREYAKLYSINTKRLGLANPNAIVMHPGPINRGVEISDEVAYGEQSKIQSQVINGVATRMSIIYLLSGNSREAPIGQS